MILFHSFKKVATIVKKNSVNKWIDKLKMVNKKNLDRKMKKLKSLLRRTAKYFFDFLVVFIGVFLAFWLNARKEEQNKKEEQVQIYRVIYEDINEFYLSGREENKDGFINGFQNYRKQLDSLIAIKKITAHGKLFGDYWNLEIINSLVESGQLSSLDPKVFKGIASFHSTHLTFLNEIESFNKQYEFYITANYENGMDTFYKPNTNNLKEKYKLPFKSLDALITSSEILVKSAENIRDELNREFNFENE